jgi:hypothetical protein
MLLDRREVGFYMQRFGRANPAEQGFEIKAFETMDDCVAGPNGDTYCERRPKQDKIQRLCLVSLASVGSKLKLCC